MRSNCRRAKKIILLAIILSAVQLLIFAGTSFSTIVGSKHDLTPSGSGFFTFDDNGSPVSPCVFCHTPHHAVSGANPLWNRTIARNTSGFTLYSSSTFEGASYNQTQPQGVTLLCLSCHDGITSLRVVANYNGGQFTFDFALGNTEDQIGDVYFPGGGLGGGANIGGAWSGDESIKDLSDDHPVGFDYTDDLVTADGHLHPPGNISPLKLYNTKLECATCHDVHEEGDEAAGTSPFLRMVNSNSEMCLKCHIK